MVDVQCLEALNSVDEPHLVSGVLRDMSQRRNPFHITNENITIIKSLAPATLAERARNFLHAIVGRQNFLGETISINVEMDYPLCFARSGHECFFYLTYLRDRGYLRWEKRASTNQDLAILPEGWVQIENDRVANFESDKVFVAMWFNDKTTDAYVSGIQPAIDEDAGYKAIRVDVIEHVGKIDDRIIAEIRESRFLVADFTGQRGGVYFEAGYAMGTGLPVIWTCHKDCIAKLHFDTRQFNHIEWIDPTDLRTKLGNRIRAIVGPGPGRKRADLQ